MTQLLDLPILYFIQDYITSSIMDEIMIAFTHSGDFGLIWIVFAITFILNKSTRRMGISMIIALLVGLLIGNLVLKNAIARLRPCDIDTSINLLIHRPSDYSMPSGHALSSFAAASVVLGFNKKYGIMFFIIATVIGFSRLYCFVHFPTDVIAGALLGALIGIGVVYASKYIDKKKINFRKQ